MPSRKRRRAPVEPLDPVSRFGLLLKESAERERAEAERRQNQRQQARAAERQARQHDEDLAAARRELERAIDGVRTARQTRHGRAEADAAWRAAKARVIELETGAPPSWAPADADADASAADANTGAASAGAADTGVDSADDVDTQPADD